jgi:hypothetical protein
MTKYIKSATHSSVDRMKTKTVQGIPLIVFIWTFGLGLLSYVVSRFVMTPHPLHWASLAGGLLLGAAIGYIWFYIRGDVSLF